ncbi:glycosyltransferase family 2 protein [Salipiger thiooxidans]|uniref:glycosyltransferase family 2 protein n=1 Tax=Salipiger thiooxidans TaxID=282683 RepID=UPI0021F5033E|nr:glycosyltransferase family 2 protein [Salipiger thiooxidans]
MFSVVIPAFNRAATVLPTLKSVRDQTFADWECIVVDDGSADGEALKAAVEGMNDPRFRYVWRENGGGGAARNSGIEAATGDYIAFLDSDDFFLPDKLATFAGTMTDDPDIAWYAPTYVDRGVEKRWVRPDRAIGDREDVGEYLFVANQFIQTSTLVLKTETARRIPFDPALRKGQDLDLCVRLQAGGVRFRMLPEPLTVWVDASEANRTSRHRGWEAPTAWLEGARPMLTDKAFRGYRATVLAYYLAGAKPFRALSYILDGWVRAGVPLGICARQIARSFIPRSTYRRAVNTYVALRGR